MNRIGQVYPSGPYDYLSEWQFFVDFTTDEDVARAMLPDRLQPDPEGRGWIRGSHHKISSFGPYFGAYFGLYAQLDGKPVRYQLSGVKTSFMGVVAGREIWGFPFVVGKIDAGWSGSMFTFRVKGDAGEELATVMLHTTRRADPIPGIPAVYTADLRDHCGNVLCTQLLTAQNKFVLDESDTWDAKATVQLPRASAMNDWSQIAVKDVVRAQFRSGGKKRLDMATVVAEW